MASLELSEIFYSIQGETSLVGRPAVFVRLSGCNLSCLWCDTAYAKKRGKEHDIAEVLSAIAGYSCPFVVITGGEPLLQKKVSGLIDRLLSSGYTVMLETNGSQEIAGVPEKVKIVLDIKPPSSGESGKMDFSNIGKLREDDEIKFVIANRRDFDWSCEVLDKYSPRVKNVLFSPVKGKVSFRKLAGWVSQEAPFARVQPNIHKIFSLQ